MSTTVEAIYEAGVLRLAHPIDLADGSRVEVIVIPRETAEPVTAPDQPAPRKRTPAEIAAGIAALSVQKTDEGFSNRDHDKWLYGEQGAR
jgi:predicted DNA-binding antitoxin AbrB/MazE fold protein